MHHDKRWRQNLKLKDASAGLEKFEWPEKNIQGVQALTNWVLLPVTKFSSSYYCFIWMHSWLLVTNGRFTCRWINRHTDRQLTF